MNKAVRNGAIRVSLYIFLLAVAVEIFFSRHGLAGENVQWRTGPSLTQHLRQPAGVSWSGSTLRPALAEFSRRQRVAVVLDRRIDPDQTIDFSVSDASLGSLFQLLAERLDAGVCYLGAVVYLGPKNVTKKLPTLAVIRKQDVQLLPDEVNRRLLRDSTWQWEELSTPRELIDQLAEVAAIQIRGVESVPHDLWAAGDLPPLSFVERLTIVLAGFDLTFEFSPDGSHVRLVAMPDDDATMERSYIVDAAKRRAVTSLVERFPDARMRVAGSRILITGKFDVHTALEQLLEGNRVVLPSGSDVEKVYTLNVENKPAAAVANYLAQQFKLKLTTDAVAKEKLEELVTFKVEEATLDEILEALLKPIGLDYRLNGAMLEIYARNM